MRFPFSVAFVLCISAITWPMTDGDGQDAPQAVYEDEFWDRERGDPELEACPHFGLPDSEISACFTRVFKADLLPRLGQGIPQLGIRSIDPVTVPKATFTFLDIGIIRWIVHVRELVITGSANMSRSDIVIDTSTEPRTIGGYLTFPRIEGKSTKTTVEGHAFGVPLQWFTQEGGITFRIDELATNVRFQLRPTKSEFVKLSNVEYDINGFLAQSHGITRPAWIDTVVNWFMRRYSLQLFQYIIRPGFLEIFTGILTTFLAPNAWMAIAGDI